MADRVSFFAAQSDVAGEEVASDAFGGSVVLVMATSVEGRAG